MGFHEQLLQTFENFKTVHVDSLSTSVSDISSNVASLTTENSTQNVTIGSLSASSSELASELDSMSLYQSELDSTQNSQLSELSISASETAGIASSLSALTSVHTSDIASLSTAASELGSEYQIIQSEVMDKQNTLTSSNGIDITNNVISTKVDGTTIQFNAQGQLVSNASASGGHTIENSSGTELTQRDVMQFSSPFTATDDSTNEKTEIGLLQLASQDIDDVVYPLPSSPVQSDSLADLNDVTISSPANNQVLQYNATAQKWENSANVILNGNAVKLTLTLVGDELSITTS